MAILAPPLDMGAIRSGLLSFLLFHSAKRTQERGFPLFFFKAVMIFLPPPPPRKPTMEWNESLSQNAQGAEKKPKQAIFLVEIFFFKKGE